MFEENISGDGAAPQPSAPVTDSAAPDAAKAAEDELDAKVRESLGEHYIPADKFDEISDAEVPKKEPETPKEETLSEVSETPGKPDEKEVVMPQIPKPEPQASRLDKRVATLYIQNLLLSGEKDVPSVDDVISDLRKYPMDKKIEALHYHRTRQKELKGIKPDGQDELDAEDRDALHDAERESIREEIRAEENEKHVKKSFVDFLSAHPELDETGKEYQPTLARAVETLWRGGMPIHEAFATVTEQIAAVKEAHEKAEEKSKQAALSGVVSASTVSKPDNGGPSWEEMAQLQETDPTRWEELVRAWVLR